MATSVRVRPAAEDGGSGGRDKGRRWYNVRLEFGAFWGFCFFKSVLTSYDVEHSGVEDGRTDES